MIDQPCMASEDIDVIYITTADVTIFNNVTREIIFIDKDSLNLLFSIKRETCLDDTKLNDFEVTLLNPTHGLVVWRTWENQFRYFFEKSRV